MAFHDDVAVTGAVTCANPSNSAAGAVSIYPVSSDMLMNVGSANTAPENPDTWVPVPMAWSGGGVINQTLAALFPGATTPTYLFLKMQGNGNGKAIVSCA